MIMYTNTITSIRIEALSDLPNIKVFMENSNLKINKSEIARQMNVDRRTVSKYIDGFEKSKSRNKPSCMDSYYETIKELLSSQTQIFYYKRVLYQFLTDNYGLTVPEPTFYHYIKNTSEFNTYFIKCADLMDSLHKAQLENRLTERLKKLSGYKLLIIDELGYLPISKNDSKLFFQLIDRRYERSSTIITTNINFSQWDDIFGDPIIANAIIDRLLHHANVITIKGKSFRLQNLYEEEL